MIPSSKKNLFVVITAAYIAISIAQKYWVIGPIGSPCSNVCQVFGAVCSPDTVSGSTFSW